MVNNRRNPGAKMEKLKKGPPKGREGVYKENSDFLGEKTNRREKNIKPDHPTRHKPIALPPHRVLSTNFWSGT